MVSLASLTTVQQVMVLFVYSFQLQGYRRSRLHLPKKTMKYNNTNMALFGIIFLFFLSFTNMAFTVKTVNGYLPFGTPK
jgi:hypothetical protein